MASYVLYPTSSDPKIRSGEAIKLAGGGASLQVSDAYRCSLQCREIYGEEKLVSAIRLNDTEQWFGVDHVFHGTGARTILVFS
jgi:hypothetical protein